MQQPAIIEQQQVGKRGAEACEDLIAVGRHYAAVIDGSTSKSKLPPLPGGLSRGQAAARAVAQAVLEAPANLDVTAFCAYLTQSVASLYARYYDGDILPHMQTHPEDRFCCSAVVYAYGRREVWLIGDCHALVLIADRPRGLHLVNPKPYEAVLARRRSQALMKALADGATVEALRRCDTGRPLIIPDMLRAMKGQNRTYAVIDGFDIPMQKVKVCSVGAATELVLASDGYPCLRPTLQKTETYLRRCLERDPLCIRLHPATKGWMEGTDSFDDRAYLRLSL